MNRIELLQKASTESIPRLRKVTEHFRQLFPELKFKPNILERSPKADTFMTTELERGAGELSGIKNDFININTQKVESKIISEASNDGNIVGHRLQELEENGKVVSDLACTDINGSLVSDLRTFEYGKSGNPIKEIRYDSSGNKVEIAKDELGNQVSVEHSAKGFVYRSENLNPDESKMIVQRQELTYQGKKIGEQEIIQNYTKSGKISKIEKLVEGKNTGLIECNPETGAITKIEIAGGTDRLSPRLKLTVEYEHDFPGICKYVNVTDRDGSTIYSVLYKNGKPVDAKGTLVDRINEYGIDSVERIGTPWICPDKKAIEWSGFDRHDLTLWDSSLLHYIE